jgi:Ras-related protein Rab-1A
MSKKNEIKIARTYLSIITLGDTTVGKTCLAQRFIGQEFKDIKLSTIGQECFIKIVNINNHEIKIKIWDTAGQERYRSIAISSIRNANGVLLVYDITKMATYETLEYWFKQIKNVLEIKDTPIVLIGNKIDLKDSREVSYEKGEEFAKDHGIKFFECSAKSKINVDEAFNCLINDIYKKHENEFTIEDKNINLSDKKKKEKKKEWC